MKDGNLRICFAGLWTANSGVSLMSGSDGGNTTVLKPQSRSTSNSMQIYLTNAHFVTSALGAYPSLKYCCLLCSFAKDEQRLI